MIPKIEFDFDLGIWYVKMTGPSEEGLRFGKHTRTGEGRHWFITVAFFKAAWEYYHDK